MTEHVGAERAERPMCGEPVLFMIDRMEFVASPGPLWLAFRNAQGQGVAGKVIGWETSGDEPVPMVLWSNLEGKVVRISRPPDGDVWAADTREDALRAAAVPAHRPPPPGAGPFSLPTPHRPR